MCMAVVRRSLYVLAVVRRSLYVHGCSEEVTVCAWL